MANKSIVFNLLINLVPNYNEYYIIIDIVRKYTCNTILVTKLISLFISLLLIIMIGIKKVYYNILLLFCNLTIFFD